jgi:outer membrane biosynthesis protein TonB
MTAAALPWSRSLALPWAHASAQERRFRRIRTATVVLVLLLALLVHFLPVPDILKPEPVEVPAPVKILLPPKPQPPPKPEPVAKPAPVAAPKPTVAEAPAPVTSSKPGSARPGPNARQRAAAAFSNAFADLSDLRDPSQVSKAVTGDPTMKGPPNPQKNSLLDGGAGTGPGSERSLITSHAGQGSGGINTAGMSRGYGGGGLAGRGTTLVAGYGGGGTGTGKGTAYGGGGGNGTGFGDGSGTGSGSGGARSREEIEMVFDQNKGALYALYNRALRENPALQGKLVLRLTIQPNGVVSACSVISSELHDADFEARLVARVKLFRFSAKDVPPITTTKPIDFFPS